MERTVSAIFRQAAEVVQANGGSILPDPAYPQLLVVTFDGAYVTERYTSPSAGRSDHCEAAVRRFGVWPTRCAVCGSDRSRALDLMQHQGYICPVCLPMQQDHIGQPRGEAAL